MAQEQSVNQKGIAAKNIADVLFQVGVLKRPDYYQIADQDNVSIEHFLRNTLKYNDQLILKAYAVLYKIPIIALERENIEPNILALFSKQELMAHKIIPYSFIADDLFVAVADPKNLQNIAPTLLLKLSKDSDVKIILSLLSNKRFDRLISQYDAICQTADQKIVAEGISYITKRQKKPTSSPLPTPQNVPVVKPPQAVATKPDVKPSIKQEQKSTPKPEQSYPYVDLEYLDIPLSTLAKIPYEIAKKYNMVVFDSSSSGASKDEVEAIKIALINPESAESKKIIGFIQKSHKIKISLFRTDKYSIDSALSLYDGATEVKRVKLDSSQFKSDKRKLEPPKPATPQVVIVRDQTSGSGTASKDAQDTNTKTPFVPKTGFPTIHKDQLPPFLSPKTEATPKAKAQEANPEPQSAQTVPAVKINVAVPKVELPTPNVKIDMPAPKVELPTPKVQVVAPPPTFVNAASSTPVAEKPLNHSFDLPSKPPVPPASVAPQGSSGIKTEESEESVASQAVSTSIPTSSDLSQSYTLNTAEIKVKPESSGAPATEEGAMWEEANLDKFLQQPVNTKEALVEAYRTGLVPQIVAATVAYAVEIKASDIHIEPEEKTLRVRYRVDGELQELIRVPLFLHAPIVSRIKILSKLKIDEQRIPQDGRFNVVVTKHQIDLRVSTMPTIHGEKIVMRVLDKSLGVYTLEQLGVTGSGFDALVENIKKPYGIILATGPTGSGKSTTLYAILNRISNSETNIITLEDPVEYELPGINQCQVKPKIGFTFAEGLRSVLRQDPNIIMVGEIRDAETAGMATHAALTGHLVLSTLHTNDASGALPRLTNMGVEPFLITSSINVVIAQRLVRKMCQNCKAEYAIPETVRAEIKDEIAHLKNIKVAGFNEQELKFYHGTGCDQCTNGYKGRIGIYEVLPMTPRIEELAVKKAPASDINKAAIEEGMITMKQDGILKALKGVTTIDEVLRVTMSA